MRRHLQLAAILGAATLLRALALLFAARLPYFRHHRLDAAFYDEAARAFARGDFSLGQPVLHASPLYQYALGAVYWLGGDGPWAIRLVQLAAGVVTVALVHASARRLFGARWALVAGWATALYGPLVFEEAQLEPEALAAALHALVLFLVVRNFSDGAPGARRWIAPGVALGLCILLRPTAALLFVAVAIPLARALDRRAAARAVAALALGALTTLAPVALRNLAYGGELALVGYNGGMNFFIGNGPGAIGTFRIPPEMPAAGNIVEQHRAFAAVAEQQAGRALSPRQVDRFWYGRAFAAIAAHPGAWLRLLGEKSILYFSNQELANNSDYSFTRRLNPILALPLVQYGALAPLALFGTILLLGARRPDEQWVAWCNLAGFVGVILFFVIGRYRVAAVPALLIAAVAALRWLVELARAHRWRALVPAALALAALFTVSFARTLDEPLSDEYFKLGYAYQIQSQPDAAERAYLSALAVDARQLSAHKNLALLYEARGEVRRAVVHWQWVYGIALERGQRDLAEFARARLAGWGQPARSPLTPTEIPPNKAN